MRLAFAVAAHLEPEILIVDEVLAVGDAEFQRKCIGRMSDISSKEGRTILFISHNMGAVERLCHKGIYLENGRVLYNGEIRDTIACYLGRVSKQNLVSFQARPGQPSITSVKIDEDELKLGNLTIDIDFESPFELIPPVPGVVVYSESSMPVWGSNSRFHRKDRLPQRASAGRVRMEAKALPLAPGNYLLSVWLSDERVDYDHKSDILSFDFRLEAADLARPRSEEVGHLDWAANWRIL